MDLIETRRTAFNVAAATSLIVIFTNSTFDLNENISSTKAAICFLILAIPYAFEVFCCYTTKIAITSIFTIYKSENPIIFAVVTLTNILFLSLFIGGAIYLV
ncbi:hypothetical protein [Pseudomonas anguilliseptica]|uniref:hypothetical protein n=1 Tax=Pseudomonas anguilliseptica TaxID=53406 RepID=UPI0022AF0BB3|nr:hypothetical protein [Pseudomonas anguilliseptica]MCZ4324267.1 hypothetical protein [Pseudomonas anguilliseptica]